MLFDPPSEIGPPQEQPVEELRQKSPALTRLEELRALQREERNYVEAIERNGGTGRVVDFLWSRLDALETEINEIQAGGRRL